MFKSYVLYLAVLKAVKDGKAVYVGLAYGCASRPWEVKFEINGHEFHTHGSYSNMSIHGTSISDTGALCWVTPLRLKRALKKQGIIPRKTDRPTIEEIIEDIKQR